MTVRRIVTGIDRSGKSVVACDTQVEPLRAAALPGYAWHRLWSLDVMPRTPGDGKPEPAPAHFPPPGGLRFNIFTVPPRTLTAPTSDEKATEELEEKFPGRSQHMEQDQAGLHTTASVDLIYVADGEIWLELDDKKELHLRKGDTLVQNGVRHAWRNHSARSCTLVICLIGTHKREHHLSRAHVSTDLF